MREPEQSLPVRHPSLSSAACTESLQNGAIILIEQLLPVRENLNLEKVIMRLLKKTENFTLAPAPGPAFIKNSHSYIGTNRSFLHSGTVITTDAE